MDKRRPSTDRRSIDRPSFGSVDGNIMMEKIAVEKRVEVWIDGGVDGPSVGLSTRDAF